jgi:hypothetical protein
VTAEHLTDGWEPDLPVSDTLLRRFLFNLAAFHEVPVAAAGGRVLRRDDFAAADLGRPAAMHNAATLLRPPGARPVPPVPPGLPAVGIFSDMSRPSAEAIGFLPLTRFTLWHRPRPGPSGAATTS